MQYKSCEILFFYGDLKHHDYSNKEFKGKDFIQYTLAGTEKQ